MPDPVPQFTFQEATDFYRAKIRLPTSGWTDIWQEQHSHGFVVAGANSDALVEDLYNAIAKAKWAGGGYAEFKDSFAEIAKKHGWAYNGTPGWRSKIIYDTNITQAYNAGRYKQMAAVKHLRPYWQYIHTPGEHPRLNHLAWNGLILPADDPWFDTHMPQNGWNCKCRVISLSRVEAGNAWKGQGKDGPDPAPAIEWEDKLVGKNGSNPRVVRVPKGVDPGFAYNPGKAWLEPHTVPLLPEHLAKLAPKNWAWPNGYKPPPSPPSHVFKGQLPSPDQSETKAVSDFLRAFDATLTRSNTYTDVTKSPLVMGASMFIQGKMPYDETLGDEQFKMAMGGKQGRKVYMPLLVDAIKDPDEIWESWEKVEKNPKFEGEQFMVRHYLKSFVIVDKDGKERYLMAVFRKSSRGWDGITTFHGRDEKYFERKRRGFLVYKK